MKGLLKLSRTSNINQSLEKRAKQTIAMTAIASNAWLRLFFFPLKFLEIFSKSILTTLTNKTVFLAPERFELSSPRPERGMLGLYTMGLFFSIVVLIYPPNNFKKHQISLFDLLQCFFLFW